MDENIQNNEDFVAETTSTADTPVEENDTVFITEDAPATEDATDELMEFEHRIDQILATGELDATLRIIDTEGVAQVLPVLENEPISHLLQGIEEIGGQANVFVKTSDGIAVLNVVEYSPDDAQEEDDVITDETAIVQKADTASPEVPVDGTAPATGEFISGAMEEEIVPDPEQKVTADTLPQQDEYMLPESEEEVMSEKTITEEFPIQEEEDFAKGKETFAQGEESYATGKDDASSVERQAQTRS